MLVNRRGFTLVEILAVMVIFGIVSSVVVSSISSLVRESKESSYNILMSSFEENARLYADRHKSDLDYNLDNFNYYVITLNDLDDDGLLKTPITDPRDNEQVNMDKQLIITRESQTTLSVCFEDRGCYAPILLANKLTENVVSGDNQGSHYDATNNFYYYRGSNPNNYVEFNDYLWRAVKVNGDDTVKLIFEGKKSGNSTIQNGTIGNSSFNSTASNNYNASLSIKTYLQNWYDTNITDENKAKVTSKKWCIGKIAANGSGTPKTTFLSNECTSQTTNELAVGMITGSEYLYASTNANCLDTLDLECTDSNYLYKSDYNYYTITGVESTNNVWRAGMNLTSGESTSSLAVRPVINLKAGIITDRGTGTLDNPYQLKDIISLDQTKPIITLVGDNPDIVNQWEVYQDPGAIATDNLDGDITNKIVKISNVDTSKLGTYTVTYIVLDGNGNKSMLVTRTVNVITGANKPVLATGMTPIKWNGTTWIETTEADSDWYNYTTTEKKWANAKTADGSMWVWIPRYVYRISSGWHSNSTGTIDIRFSDGTDDTILGTTVLDTGTDASASNNKWTNHPAFNFGEVKLTGIWVAKFEATAAEGVANGYTSNWACPVGGDNVTSKTAKIVPNAVSWRCIHIGNAFTVAKNMETNGVYGWGTSGLGIDTHLIKNTEWGAVAYLSKSLFGKNNEEIWINPANNYTTGCAGDSVSSAETVGCLRSYETPNGQKASTTGNVYGIYDMAGGAFEVTAAHVNNFNMNLNMYGLSITSANIKYKDLYSVGFPDSQFNNYVLTSYKKGDAVYETTNNVGGAYSWYGDYNNMPNLSTPWFVRGNFFDDTTESGIFELDYTSGAANSGKAFRPVLLVIGSNPSIALNGREHVGVILGTTYTDDGAAAFDEEDGDITSNIVTTGVVNPNVAGTYYIKYNVADSHGNNATEVVRTVYVAPANVTTNYTFIGNYQLYTIPLDGTYKLEVWGAEGGSSVVVGASGGDGGYSYGEKTFIAGQTIYIYVGGQGYRTGFNPFVNYAGGWNGGGSARGDYLLVSQCGTGGGATDIRTVSGAWYNSTSLASRIIVAGGGGGSGSTVVGYDGGRGGGINGTMADGVNNDLFGGYGGTQTAGGAIGGTLGAGGNDIYTRGGGGGGYYGGGAGRGLYYGGGGGSGYINGLTNAISIAGNESMPAPDGSTETGHNGYGYARISRIP